HGSRIVPALNRGAPGETRRRRETIGPDRARLIGFAAERGPRASAFALVRAEPVAGGSQAGASCSVGRENLAGRGWVSLCARYERPKSRRRYLPSAGFRDCRPPRRTPRRKKSATNPRRAVCCEPPTDKM